MTNGPLGSTWEWNALADRKAWASEEFQESLALDLALGQVQEAQLIEAVASADQSSLRARLSDPDFQARRDAAALWVGRFQEEREAWSQTATDEADALSARILSQTRQERSPWSLPDGWRGDWRLIRGFLGSRLQSSWVMRVAAASLLAHLVALPAVAAYVFWVKPKSEPLVLTWDLPQPAEVDEVIPGPEVLEVGEDLWSELGLEAENLWARNKHTLEQELVAPSWVREDPLLSAYWDWRLAPTAISQGQELDSNSGNGARSASPSQAIQAAPRSDWESDGVGLGEVLVFEAWLDDWVRGQDPGSLGGNASPLVEAERGWIDWIAGWALGHKESEDPVVVLAMHTLRRAEGLGLPITTPGGSQVRARLQAVAPALADPTRPGAPLDGPWFELLKRAHQLDQGARAVGRAWAGRAPYWRALWRP